MGLDNVGGGVMVIGGRCGIAVSGIVLMGFVLASAAMKVAAVEPATGKDAKAAQVVDAKQEKVKLDEERMFKRTVALYRAIFARNPEKVRSLLKWPIYINGVKTLWNWACCGWSLYYLSDPALPVRAEKDWLLVTTPLNLAIKCALAYHDPNQEKQSSAFDDYYRICTLLVQQRDVRLNVFIEYDNTTYATPLHVAMQECAWPIVKLLIDHGAKPEELNYDGKTAFGDKKRVNAYWHWKASHSRQKSCM
jgi:hypothetical protein